MKGLTQINVKFSTEKHLCTFLLSIKHTFEGHEILCTKYRACGNTLKLSDLKVHISLKENKLACFTNSSGSFELHDLVHDFWKKYYEVHASSQCWCRDVRSVSAYKAYKKNHVPEFPIFSALKENYFQVYLWFFLIQTRIYLQKERISKHSWKKTTQLLWAFVIYLLQKCWRWIWTWYW